MGHFDPSKDYKLRAPDDGFLPKHMLDTLCESEGLILKPMIKSGYVVVRASKRGFKSRQ